MVAIVTVVYKGTIDNDAPVQHMSFATRRIPPSLLSRSLQPVLAHGQLYTTQTPSRPPAPKTPPTQTKRPSASVPYETNVTGRDARHEVHEGNAVLNVPFNPPGAGGGPGIGGTSSAASLTGSALLDAALTTIIGLSMGEYMTTSYGTTSE